MGVFIVAGRSCVCTCVAGWLEKHVLSEWMGSKVLLTSGNAHVEDGQKLGFLEAYGYPPMDRRNRQFRGFLSLYGRFVHER